MYNNRSKFKLHFQSLWDTYRIKCKPTSVKNPQANAILERIHAVLGNMLHTYELNMAKMVKASDIDVFLLDAAWAFALPTIQCFKPPQGQQYLDKICYLTFCS